MSPLGRLLARIQAATDRGIVPVVLFDLDSTLFSTQERNWAILAEFVARDGLPPRLAEVVATLGPERMGWNVMEDVRVAGFDHASTLDELRAFWFERFFRDAYLHHDQPLPGAVEFARGVHDAGGHVVYLTGRDEPNMGQGTRSALTGRGFPFACDRADLMLKPAFEEPDLDFKRRAIADVKKLGTVLGVFENEPVNANLFAEAFPDADVFFLETVHSPDPPPLAPRIQRLKDFRLA